MILIATSTEDAASMNIRARLLALRAWQEIGIFEGNPVYRCHDFVMATTNDAQIFYDDIDQKVKAVLDIADRFSLVIYASRHRSSSNLNSLTVHSIGNFARAEHGGHDDELVRSAPHVVTTALRFLHDALSKQSELNYTASFEATHHGPFLKTPCCFIEIGSDEAAWKNQRAGEIVASALLHAVERTEKNPVAIGIGGGHYAPRQTEVALEKKISFGHILPSHQLEHADEATFSRMLAATPDVESVYFDRKSIKKSRLDEMAAWFRERDVNVVRKKDLA